MAGAKRVGLCVGCALILIGGLQPAYLRVFAWDRTALRGAFAEIPYGKLPGYRAFLEDVREKTPEGATIFLAFPTNRWREGYEYPYGRAVYVLAGRDVLPQITEFERPHPDLILRARFVVAWGIDPRTFSGFRVLWQRSPGVLLERIQ